MSCLIADNLKERGNQCSDPRNAEEHTKGFGGRQQPRGDKGKNEDTCQDGIDFVRPARHANGRTYMLGTVTRQGKKMRERSFSASFRLVAG
jgi:hypothetical protein